MVCEESDRGSDISATGSDARKVRGLELYEKALREVAGNAAFDIGVSPALPFGWTKRAWDLLLSGEDIIGVIRLYGQLYSTVGYLCRQYRAGTGLWAYKENQTAQGLALQSAQWLNEPQRQHSGCGYRPSTLNPSGGTDGGRFCCSLAPVTRRPCLSAM